MNSMTGHGRGECARDGFTIVVELSSVNRRQAEISLALPRELEPLEAPLREVLHRAVARGRVTGRVTLRAAGRDAARLHLDTALARAYARELAALARRLKLKDEVTLDHLLRAPGVFQSDADPSAAEKFQPAAKKALDQALAALLKMRAKEGAHLAADLRRRVATMRASAGRVRRRAPEAAERYRAALLERVKAAGLDGVDPRDERLLKEVVLFADRADISEEITRLESHFQQFDDLLKAKEPVGRTLDFLAQEMNREINTIGAKANDALVTREVVALKAELEKFREQAMNVE